MVYAYACQHVDRHIEGFILRFDSLDSAYDWAFRYPQVESILIPDELLGEYHVDELVFLPSTVEVEAAYFETI